ncbi:MAG: hypothetical protein IJ128_02425 [Firmicutes bacterium]|nr:hypothetical protein [Bacillota bacterium]
MSRAFVTDKEDWASCAKAGERCMYAEAGKDCRRTSCEHYDRQLDSDAFGSAAADAQAQPALRTVRRESGKADAAGGKSGSTGPAKTKRAKLDMPRRWGGRSGNNF